MKPIEMLMEYLNDMVCIVEIMEHMGYSVPAKEWEARCSKYLEHKQGCMECYTAWLCDDEVWGVINE